MNDLKAAVQRQESEINCLRDRVQVLSQEIKCLKKKIENLKMWMLGIMGGAVVTLLGQLLF
ncbi:MAG: hypothetical protein HPY50_16630 [Firmicutes bacterium]|nr:hypothetical protein [Bacillota bacterium]